MFCAQTKANNANFIDARRLQVHVDCFINGIDHSDSMQELHHKNVLRHSLNTPFNWLAWTAFSIKYGDDIVEKCYLYAH